MGFVLMKASSMLHLMMDAVFKDDVFVQTCFDNVVGHAKTIEEQIIHLENVFAVINAHRLKLKICKCESTKSAVELIGHIVSPGGVAFDPKILPAIQDAAAPFDQRSLRSLFWILLATTSGSSKYFAEISALLYSFTSRLASFHRNDGM